MIVKIKGKEVFRVNLNDVPDEIDISEETQWDNKWAAFAICCFTIGKYDMSEESKRAFANFIIERCNFTIKKKPPLGLMPRYVCDRQRQQSICEAIKRYLDDGETAIPIEWVEEYNELVAKLKEDLK